MRLAVIAAGAFVGALSGYLYWYHIACNGSCFIGSSPLISIAYGALLIGLTTDELRNFKIRKNKINERN